MHTRNLKLDLEYDGSGFAGWQVQPDRRTVQGVLEDAVSDLAGERLSVTGAGRTDAGVHALKQVAHVRCSIGLSAATVGAAVNARLPEDVLVHRVEDVPLEFHARYDAVSRSYAYLIGLSDSPLWRLRRWSVRADLDAGAMAAAAEGLAGEHDFESFTLKGSEPDHHRCHVTGTSIECDPRHGGMLIFRVESNRFLRGMVRSMVGTLVEVGRGRLVPGDVALILAARDRARAGPTAPPHGLYLVDVTYG
jgi:tRNA pseudouridine38-40 synthase